MCRARFQNAATALATLAMLSTMGCSHETPAVNPDANAAISRDASILPRARRRRGRRGGARNAIASAQGNGASTESPAGNAQSNSHASLRNDPGQASADDMAMGDEPEEPAAPRERPRMTETGPMLPDDVGRAANVAYDMTAGAATGPMGLEPSQISRGLDPLLGRLSNCAAATSDGPGRGPHGRVSVRLRIRPTGAPAAARVSGGGGTSEFVTCVRRVVASARFASFNGPDAFATWGFDVD